MQKIIEKILRRWMNRTKEQHTFLVYIALIIAALFAFPLLKVQALDAVEAKSIWFLGSGMLWLQIVIIAALIKLIGLNSSAKWRKTIYRILGWNNNEHLDNALILFVMLLIILTISEVIRFYGSQISTVVTPTWALICTEIILLGGVIRQLMLTRLQWKKSTQKPSSNQATKVPYEIDVSKKEQAFSSTAHDEADDLEGLFGKR